MKCDGKTAIEGAEANGKMDNTITDGHDETGKATVNLTVPQEAGFLQITTDAGSELNFPVAVEGNKECGVEQPGEGDEQPGTDGSLSGSSKGGVIAAVIGVLAVIIGGATAISWVQKNGGIPANIVPQWARDMLPQWARDMLHI